MFGKSCSMYLLQWDECYNPINKDFYRKGEFFSAFCPTSTLSHLLSISHGQSHRVPCFTPIRNSTTLSKIMTLIIFSSNWHIFFKSLYFVELYKYVCLYITTNKLLFALKHLLRLIFKQIVEIIEKWLIFTSKSISHSNQPFGNKQWLGHY